MKNILITGAAGFIGKHLCEKLTDKHVLYPLDALTTDASKKRMTFLSNLQTASIHSDFIDKQTTKPDIVIHLAAETGISGSLNNPALYFHQLLP